MELVPVLSGSLHVATAFCQKMFRGFLFWQVKQSRGKISKCTQCNIRTLPLCEQNSLKQNLKLKQMSKLFLFVSKDSLEQLVLCG